MHVLHYSAISPKAFLRFNPAPRQAQDNLPRLQRPSFHSKVVAFVSMQFSGTPTRTPTSLTDGCNRVHRRFHHLAVVNVGRGQRHGLRDTVLLRAPVALRARSAAIRWIRAGFVVSPGAVTLAESITARGQSICSAWPSLFSNRWWSFCHRPAHCQAHKRRQQVMPLPQPISCGNISQGMPLLSIKTMPVCVARTGTGGRLPLGRGRGEGASV